MKTIGFVDYYINEWHADNYPKWINEASEALGLDYKVAYAWAEKDISPVNGKNTDEWCESNHVSRCATLEELCEKSDYILVLAPSDPEKHLGYAETVLKYHKRTYIDKTFAPDFATTEKIFAIGKENNAPFFSTSALRYAAELEPLRGNVDKVIITGGGRLFEEYLIHMVEMAVVLFPETTFSRVKTENIGRQRIVRVQSADGKEAVLAYSPSYGYSIAYETSEGETDFVSVTSSFFLDLIKDILKFYETGALPFDSKETIEVMRVRDAILRSEKTDGEWLTL